MKALVIGSILSGALLFSQHSLAAENACTTIGHYDSATNTYEGPTWCTGVSADGIIVRGPLITSRSTLSGTTTVSGTINASSSQFSTIVMDDNHSLEKVTLKKNSTVNGDITFSGLKGMVYLDSTSKIAGKVINGDVVNQ